MVKKSLTPETPETPAPPEDESGERTKGTVKESANQIWLAGLAAFTKAQEEGGKMFDALVKEGTSIQRKTQAAAEDKFSEASSKMATMATDVSSRASGQWDKLETIFEDRVSKALHKLGVPLASEVEALNARVEELTRTVNQLRAQSSASPTGDPAAPQRRAVGVRSEPGAKRASTPGKTL